MKNKMINVIMILGIFFCFAKAEEMNLDKNSKKEFEIKETTQVETQPTKPQLDKKVEISEKKILSDLVSKCSDENKIKFYKSLVFINGKVASMNIESIKECVSNDDIASLLETFGKEGRGVKDTKCGCDVIMKQYQCNTHWMGGYCDTSTCKGSCKNSKNNSSLFRDGYIDMEEIFTKVPENIARDFAGSFIIDDGKVSGYYYGEILKYLGPDKTKELLENLI
jgi:hypothetical protein